ncbi:hypothetical protein DENSPDRAFT_838046 [Dentipellis sp. KUC8613]|nr:hypothetical protein DENSPDRAFT_838046 [Dentipellis sp. KUC8613]
MEGAGRALLSWPWLSIRVYLSLSPGQMTAGCASTGRRMPLRPCRSQLKSERRTVVTRGF